MLIMRVDLIEVESLVRGQLFLELLLFLSNLALLCLNIDGSNIDSAPYLGQTSSLLWRGGGGGRGIRVVLGCTGVVQSFHDLTIRALKLVRVLVAYVRLVVLEYCLLHAHSVHFAVQLPHECNWHIGHKEKDVDGSPGSFSV